MKQAMQNTYYIKILSVLMKVNLSYNEKLKEVILKQDHPDPSHINCLAGSRYSIDKDFSLLLVVVFVGGCCWVFF